MYKLKGNAPELSYHVNIAYDGEEQLKALEDVYGPIGSTSLWLERFEKGYFGTVSGEPVVWGKFGTDDTVLQFLDVFKEVAETEAKTKGLDTRAPLLTEEEKQGIITAKENGTSFVNFYEEVLHQSTAIKFGTQSTPELYKGVSEEELMKAWLYPEITKEVD